MKKPSPYYLLSLALLLSIGLRAQVTIGDTTKPNEFSVLELISNNTAGLRMPRLTTEDRDNMTITPEFVLEKENLAKGLTIYNTTIDCLEFWNGVKWVPNCKGQTPYVPVIEDTDAKVGSCVPYMFTYQMMELTATHSSATPLSYQWVVDGKVITGATGDKYSYVPPADIDLITDDSGNQLKIVTITCQMMIGADLKQTPPYRLTVVKATKGVLSPIYVNAWKDGSDTERIKLAFAHVNLGAENVTNPCECLGDMYQWGRRDDGHEKRTSPGSWVTGGIGNIDLDSYGQVASTDDMYGKFIFSTAQDWRNPSINTLWGDGTDGYFQDKANGDPCPAGWKIPSQKQWGAIYKGGILTGAPGAATANNWFEIGTWTADGAVGNLVESALFLPAAGYRNNSGGSFDEIGTGGYYWSSTIGSGGAYRLYFHKDNVVPGNTQFRRAIGHPVRCVTENIF